MLANNPGLRPNKKAPNPVDVVVGARVRTGRLLRSLSQETLAASLGLTFQQVQKYEKGANRIGSSRMIDIARALKLPVTFFYEGVAQPGASADEAPAEVAAFLATAAGIAVAKAFSRVRSRRVRKAMLDMILAMAEIAEGAPPEEAGPGG